MLSDMEAGQLTRPLLQSALEAPTEAAQEEGKSGKEEWAKWRHSHLTGPTSPAQRELPPDDSTAPSSADHSHARRALESEPSLMTLTLATASISGVLAVLGACLGVFACTGKLDTETVLVATSSMLLILPIGVAISRCLLARQFRVINDAINEQHKLMEAAQPWPPTSSFEYQASGSREASSLMLATHRLSRALVVLAKYLQEDWMRRIIRGDAATTMPLVLDQTEVTILFADIANYTTLCEHMPCQNLHRLLGSYFDAAISIFKNFEGTVCEILGDGLLIYFNAPSAVVDHCGKACLSAIALQEALKTLNRSFAAQMLPQVSVRIGINTGKVFAGTLGSKGKLKFGCIGDPVNVASRLESLCKAFGVRIMISEATRSQLPHWGFLYRKLGQVRLKGKSGVTSVHELLEPVDVVGETLALQPARAMTTRMQSETANMEPWDAADTETARVMKMHGESGIMRQLRAEDRKHGTSRSDLALPEWRVKGEEASKTAESSTSEEKGSAEFLPQYSGMQRMVCHQYELAVAAFEKADFAFALTILEELLARCPEAWCVTSCELLRQQVCTQMDEGLFSDHEFETWAGILDLHRKEW